MIWQAVIAHAPGEENLAEKIVQPLQEAGYGVSYRGTVLVGESFTEEASKALSAGGPVILCATIKAMGTPWAHLLVNSTLARADKKRIFAVRMEELAYLDHIVAGTAVAEYWQDPERGIQDLLKALHKHYPLEQESAPIIHVETLPAEYLDRTTAVSRFNPEALSRFRTELRAGTVEIPPADLDAQEFLHRASLMRNGFLTLTGVLLFGDLPTDLLPSAFSRCVVYLGPTKTADREPLDVRGTVIDQITGLYRQIASRIRTRERVRADSPRAEVLYEYPMRTIREIIANALVHRDYEDPTRCVHVRLFTDHVEVLSPGDWIGVSLPADGSAVSLGALVSESVKRNLRLATVVSWARLVEGEGSGLPTAVDECREVSAPEPTVSFVSGFVKVTIFPLSGWTATEHPAVLRTTMPALHQLPSPPADFVGREEELSRLLLGLGKDSTGVAIQGLGGVGKTTLALKLAEDLTSSYPDAQIYVDLRGVDPTPLSSEQAMGHVIRSFHPEAHLPDSKSELAGFYRSVLHGKRTLLLFDNAANAEQVSPLIPPSGHLILVTSRFRFTLPGLLTEPLDVFSGSAARALLFHMTPRIGDAADEIARLCGYLPLALRLAGAFLAERPDLSVQEYMRRLAKDPEGRTSLAASIRLSYDLLGSELQRCFRGLSVFPSSFDRAAAATVLGLDPERVAEVLGELVRDSLLAWDVRGSYRFHPLLRSFAESQLEESEGHAARQRHAQHYLQVLGYTSLLYERGGEDLHRALELFDREWENFKAGHTWVTAHASENEESARLCMAYPNAGAYCLDLRLSPQERIRWIEPALAAARHLKDKSEAILLGSLGNAYLDLGELDRAASFYEEWLKVARTIGDRHAEGQALSNLGNVHEILRDFPRAIRHLEEHLQIAREIGNRRGEGVALGNLANVLKSAGDLERALSSYEQRLAIARELGDRRGEGTALGNLGNAYATLGQTQQAVEIYQQQLAIAREIGDRRGEGIALGSLGDGHIILGEQELALEFYHQAQTILHEIGDRPGEMGIAWKLGRVEERGGRK